MIVLGPVGRNLGAGMTGGELFLYDPDGQALDQLNDELVRPVRPDEFELIFLRELIEAHHELTGSAVAGEHPRRPGTARTPPSGGSRPGPRSRPSSRPTKGPHDAPTRFRATMPTRRFVVEGAGWRVCSSPRTRS